MVTNLLKITSPIILASIAACATTQNSVTSDADIISADQYAALKEKEAQITRLESELKATRGASDGSAQMTPTGDLLPPGATSGECYARVWVPATYRTLSKKMLVKEAGERVEIIPAKYEWAEERVLVKEASSRLEPIPAAYTVEKETIKVADAAQAWRTGPGRNAPPASNDLLATAKKYGIDLDAAASGTCYHEHYRPASFETIDQQVLVKDATKKVSISAPEYRWTEKQVLVKEASSKMSSVPAAYGWEEEQVLDKPAHTIWKKGSGPIQRIDESTGEIMCLVDVPATYKTIRKRVLKSAATTKLNDIPAEYKTVKVRELVTGPRETVTEIPASYRTVKVTQKTGDASFVWHEIHDRHEPASTRTGAKVCLTETPARHKTVSHKVLKSAASTRKVEIPAAYKTVKLRKLLAGPQEKRSGIAAEYKMVTYKELENEGSMEWRSILCRTNMTGTRVSQIQQALKTAGYNPGPIDGSIGGQTMAAVNNFQRAKGLPVDKYLNIKTLEALGISSR